MTPYISINIYLWPYTIILYVLLFYKDLTARLVTVKVSVTFQKLLSALQDNLIKSDGRRKKRLDIGHPSRVGQCICRKHIGRMHTVCSLPWVSSVAV